MSRDTDFSDETLTAYLDGALSDADAARVADALADTPNLADRLEALDVPLGDLRPAFETMLREMPSGLVPAAPQRGGINMIATAITASVVLAAGVGLGAYLSKASSTPGDWHDYVAAYQALYVEDTLSVVEQTPVETQAQLARVAAKLGRDLITATDVPGFSYKRAQVLGFQGKPLVQLAYLTDSGAPMALCIIRTQNADALETMRLEGLEAASWSDGTFAYLLIGGDDAAQVAAAAAHLQAQL